MIENIKDLENDLQDDEKEKRPHIRRGYTNHDV